MSRPSHHGSSIGGGRPPSSASSVASGSRMGFPNQRDSARSAVNPHNEDALHKHYMALKHYLAPSLQDDHGKMRPNRARDKLLRLSVTQFMELSTDVYDELIRREDERLQRVRDVPHSLPPKQNFHPKRNQARQKLSTLPIERFRQLATDVFFELERRIPRFAVGDMDRPMSSASGRAPSRGGIHPPYGMRGPPSGMGGPPRPLPRTFQSNTMVPNKGTMIEDDEDEDEFALDNVVTGLARRDTNLSNEQALQDEIDALKRQLSEKDEEIEKARTSGQGFDTLREELEQKNMNAQKLNDELRRELDQLHKDKTQDERDIRAQHDRNLDDLHTQMDDLHAQLETHQSESRELRMQLQQGQHQPSDSELQRRVDLLQQELANQEKLTKEVRDEATMLLQEMRDLSQQNDQAIEQEERLAAQVAKLEKDVDHWRQRYARIKAQNKSLRASHVDLGLHNSFDAGSLLRQQSLVSTGGLVKDVDVTRFQLAIEELLRVARQSGTESMIDSMKNVAVSVQSITSVVGTDGYPTPSSPNSPAENTNPQPASVAKLKARVTGTANSLITQTKLHASAHGLSPVALLDAAASNLSAAVVELIKAVGIRASPRSELDDAPPATTLSAVDPLQFPRVVDPHESMGSYYEDRMSRSDHEPPFQYDDQMSAAGDEHHDHDEEDDDDYYDESDSFPGPATPTVRVQHDMAGAAGMHHDANVSMMAPAVQISSAPAPAPAPASPPGSIGRNNTFKKMNGWFGWGSKGSNGESPISPTMGTEYDPYR